MRTKHLVFALVILIVAFSQIRAELPAPLIEADTVFKIKTNGAKGVVFLPDGNSVIMMCQDTPYLIDAKTWQVIRQFETNAGQSSENVNISKDGKYLIAQSDKGLCVWDVLTGKILKYLRSCGDYCLSPDGTKLYGAYMNENNKGVIRIYDLSKLEEIEVFCNHGFTSARDITCSPDGSTLAVSVFHHSSDEKINSVILIDLKNKTEYTEIQNMVPLAQNLQFSPDGKYLMYIYSNSNNSKERYTLLYDIESKGKKIISEEDIRNLFEYKTSIGFSYFYDNQTISINYSSYVLIWDIAENKIKKMINFYAPYHDIFNNKLLLCDYQGNLAMLDLLAVSVEETQKPDNNTISYSNNLIDYSSDKAFAGEIEIFDITGKTITNLGTQPIIIGKNIIRVNQSLPDGIYILIIKNGTEQYSYKFIVE